MINSICICGAGTMGIGIAQLAAQAGFRTILFDVNPEAVTKAKNEIHINLLALEQKGKLKTGAADGIASAIQYTNHAQDCHAELCIEAIAEKLDAKVTLFNELAGLNEESILVSNTSSLSITNIAEALPRRENVAGMHFFNPAPVMKLVEIVTTKYTSAAVTQVIVEIAQKMGKTPVL
jgi:3-hydroxybutyryl-CoA dehydrogenase